MDYSATEQTINHTLLETIESATLSSDYKPGDSITLLLEHAINTITYSDNVSDLWGPIWSLFLIMVASRIRPEVSPEIVESGVKDILVRMVGCSDTTPNTALSIVTWSAVTAVDKSLSGNGFMKPQYMETAVKVCSDLGIPSPVEVTYLYNALGELSPPYEAKRLYEMKPDNGKPISKDDIPGMITRMKLGDAKQAIERVVARTKQTTTETNQSIVEYQQKILTENATVLFNEILPIVGYSSNSDNVKAIVKYIRNLEMNVTAEEIDIAITAVFDHIERFPHDLG